MPTNDFATHIVTGLEVGSSFEYRNKSSVDILSTIVTSTSNLITYYRMQGYDTISNSMKVWVVQGTPDVTAARYPNPSSVSIVNGFIVSRWQA